MSIEDKQQLMVSGSILHLARYLDDGITLGAVRDVGTIQVVNPASTVTTISLFDSRSGRRVKVAERTTEYAENYEIICSNMSLDNLAFTFGADAVAAYVQTTTPITGVPHLVYPNSILHLHDNSGNYMYNIGTLTSIGSLVAGTDYTASAQDLAMGIAHILAPAGVPSTGTNLNVAFVPNAVTGQRVFNPQTAGVSRCHGWVYWPYDDQEGFYVRDHVDMNVAPANPEFRDTDFSQMRFTLAILSDLQSTSRPAGRVLHAKGNVPPYTM